MAFEALRASNAHIEVVNSSFLGARESLLGAVAAVRIDAASHLAHWGAVARPGGH